MEWTKEKLEKLQEQINKKWFNYDPDPVESDDPVKSDNGYDYSIDKKMWHDILKDFGIDVHHMLSAPYPYIPYIHDDGNVRLSDPFYSWFDSSPQDMLVVSQEDAEKILIIGL